MKIYNTVWGGNEAEKRDREGRPSRLVTFMILLAKNNPLVRSLCLIVRSAHVRHAVLTLTLTRCLGFRTLVRIRWHSLLGSRVQHYKFFPTPVSLPFFNPQRENVYTILIRYWVEKEALVEKAGESQIIGSFDECTGLPLGQSGSKGLYTFFVLYLQPQ